MSNKAFMVPVQADTDLSLIVGSDPIPRTEMVKRMWGYIKTNGLQDASNKRNVNADEKLLKVFGKPQVTMFEIPGAIARHLVK